MFSRKCMREDWCTKDAKSCPIRTLAIRFSQTLRPPPTTRMLVILLCTFPFRKYFLKKRNHFENQENKLNKIPSKSLVDKPEVKLIAWTTTPWTLPSNLALAVNPEFVYLKVKDKKSGDTFIVAECRITDLYKTKDDYTFIEKIKGKDLENLNYVPLFDDHAHLRNNGCFRVLCGDFVTKDTG